MTVDDPIGIIELGNFNIKCLIFKISNNNVEILSTSITPSDGFHNDIVVNLSKASSAIRVCISNAEKEAQIQDISDQAKYLVDHKIEVLKSLTLN